MRIGNVPRLAPREWTGDLSSDTYSLGNGLDCALEVALSV